MGRSIAEIVVVGMVAVTGAGCGFDGSRGEPADIDARPDTGPEDMPSCSTGIVDLCARSPVEQLFEIRAEDDKGLDTDNDPACIVVEQADGPSACLLYYRNVTIAGSLVAYGARPLVLAAADRLLVSGVVDVSSRRDRLTQPGAGSQRSSCSFADTPGSDGGRGGGGAGGTFLSAGGAGGTGGGAQSRGGRPAQPFDAELTMLRGGCHGQNGASGANNSAGGNGGFGGGAISLHGGTVEISGRILAVGAGGGGGSADRAGGGGGGSGGMIAVQGLVINVRGLLLATGGGGGEGGDRNNTGEPGTEATTVEPARGGAMRPAGGDGGSGAVEAAGGAGSNNNDGGGGGGGGTGTVLVVGPTPSLSSTVAPRARTRTR